MPDGFNIKGPSQLGSIGSGIMETYFGGLLQQQKTEREQKDQETARRLAAFHALLQHPETPESEVPNILDSIAKELKADKDFAPVTAHMRAGMSRRVPTGPERETGESRFNRMKERSSAEGMGLVPDLPAQEMYQPTAEYGSLSQGEAARAQQMQTYREQQDIQTDRAVQLNKLTTDRQLQVEREKEAARLARQEAEYKLKLSLLEPKERLQADRQRSQFKQSLIANGMDAVAADAKAGEMVINLADATLGQRKASAEASRATAQNRLAQIKHWNNQDEHAIRMESITGLSAAAARQFNMQTREDFPELSRVKSELIRLQTLKAAMPGNPIFDAEIQTLEDRRDELQLKIDAARLSLQQQQSTGVPTAPQGGGSPRPKSDPLGLFPTP